MTGPWRLGNDVVDLLHRVGTGRGRDPRFLRRICSESERRTVLESPDSDGALWIHWAAKEAIFKSASKELGSPPTFHQPSFEVDFAQEDLDMSLTADTAGNGTWLKGAGRFRDLAFEVWAERRSESVHAISWALQGDQAPPAILYDCTMSSEDTRGPRGDLKRHFSPLEWACVTHRASALTRILARRALADNQGVKEAALEIRCGPGEPGRRIPSVWLQGKPLPVDLTLSHHGRFLAYAFLSRRDGEDPRREAAGPAPIRIARSEEKIPDDYSSLGR